MKRDLFYENLAALKPVHKLLEEAAAGVKDNARTIFTSGLSEVLGAAAGAGAGGAASLAILSSAGVAGLSGPGIMSGLAAAGGVVGAGAAAGVVVLAAPAVVAAVAGYAFVSARNRKKLQEQKAKLVQEALRQRDAVLRHLKEEADASHERVEYLTALNIRLQEAIRNLKRDLGSDPEGDGGAVPA